MAGRVFFHGALANMANTQSNKMPPREEWIDLPAPERIKAIGHRAYVGGQLPKMWYGIGRRQYHFLVSQGLRSHHAFLDIACGSLRLGQFLIPFLDEGNYYGLEAEPALVEAGLREEILFDIAEIKRPTFSHGYDFDFSFVPRFDIAMAQSLFTHLTEEDIQLCLTNLRKVAVPDSQLFFTFFQGTFPNPDGPSHANKGWQYTPEVMQSLVRDAGWDGDYIGNWGHERKQVMMRVSPRA